jgi:hypothetical protein
MKTIAIKYVDTKKYRVEIKPDWDMEGPDTWGNYKIIILKDRDHHAHEAYPDGIFTENENLTPAAKSKLRAGTMFTITYQSYSSADGGHYTLDGAIDGTRDDIDGFIVFEPEYIKGTSYEERKEYARQDLEQYTEWAQGNVYSYYIEDEAGEFIDSCSGFIGNESLQYGIAEALPDAVPENVELIGIYPGTCGHSDSTYELYFDYADCLKQAGRNVCAAEVN